jgi:hypothetical protein
MFISIQKIMAKGLGIVIFGVLLVLVIVAFVLYLSQGSSIFDFLPDPQKETKEFYGSDLNDPQERRLLNVQNGVASDFGVIIGPVGEVMEKAEVNYYQVMQAQLQKAFQSNPRAFDQTRLTLLFQEFQSWPNQPKPYKVRRIAMAGLYDSEFSQSSIRAKLAMDAQADSWGLLPLGENILIVNNSFNEFLGEISPVLEVEENRTVAFENVGQAYGLSARDVEGIIYSHFRAQIIDEIYQETGFVLNEEAKLDLRLNDFAWDAEALSLGLDDLGQTGPYLAKLVASALPATGDTIAVSYGDQKRTFVCVEQLNDSNSSDVQFLRGKDVVAFAKNLSESIEQEDLGFSASVVGPGALAFSPDAARLPQSFPSFESSSESVVFTDDLLEPLKAFHEERKSEDVFARPSRTFATAVTFRSKDFFTAPQAPGEARMRSYFERNKEVFDLPPPPPPSILPPAFEANGTIPPEGEQGPVGKGEANASGVVKLALPPVLSPDSNVTKTKQVTFEDVKEEVRQRIIEGDRIDAEREAEDLAREAALTFLIEINDIGDKLRRKYPVYEQRRQSAELAKLVSDGGGGAVQIEFSEAEIESKANQLGLEKTETLQEVASLNEKMFFTRSRRTREGFAIFLLDKKEEKSPGQFSDAPFSRLFEEYASQFRSDEFVRLADKTLESLQSDGNVSLPVAGLKVGIERKNSRLTQGYFKGVNDRIGSQLEKLGKERGLISSAERESNATKEQLERKESIDAEIEVIRVKQAKVNKEMTLALRLSEECSNLMPDGQWSELERTESSAVFVRLKKAYTLKAGGLKPGEVETRASDLQYAKAERGRDLLLRDIISRELEKKD